MITQSLDHQGRTISGASPCRCRQVRTANRPPQKPALAEHYANAVQLMAGMIPFFPQGEVEQAFIATQLTEWVDTKGDLDRLVKLACTRVKKWEGLLELWRTCDEGLVRDYEAVALQENERRLEAYKQESLSAPESERVPFPLPPVKMIA